jgi:F0F1-type ATP synthase alpha subunit
MRQNKQNPRSVKNMVNVNQVYRQYRENAGERNYLNATSVVSENLNNTMLTIKNGEVRKLGQGEEARNKIVLSFNETDKQLALNISNSKIITQQYGDDSDLWTGKQITLVVVKKNFAGKLVDGIQVETL